MQIYSTQIRNIYKHL